LHATHVGYRLEPDTIRRIGNLRVIHTAVTVDDNLIGAGAVRLDRQRKKPARQDNRRKERGNGRFGDLGILRNQNTDSKNWKSWFPDEVRSYEPFLAGDFNAIVRFDSSET
jgi:hypothetical protein